VLGVDRVTTVVNWTIKIKSEQKEAQKCKKTVVKTWLNAKKYLRNLLS